MDFSKYQDVMDARSSAQEVDEDRREKMTEIERFVTVPGAQWEENVSAKFNTYGRPQYTIDRCRPVLNQVWGEIARNDFNIKVKPMGGKASKDTAKTYAGLVRNVETLSNAEHVYAQAGKKAIQVGMGAWRLEQDYVDGDSFDQDLFIRPIHDAHNRVWFLGNFQMQTGEDSDGVIIEHSVSAAEYKELAEETETDTDSAQSLGQQKNLSLHEFRRENITIGELIYKEPVTHKLYRLPDGEVVNEEDAQKTGHDLESLESRTREAFKIKVRFFDGAGWITKPHETVFDFLPVIPVFPNFEISGDKPYSLGAIEFLMDGARTHNYSYSKLVEDTALAPKPKLMMTKEQAAGHGKTLGSMNTNSDPVQVYNHIEGQAPPFQTGHPGVNPGLMNIIGLSGQAIEESAGLFGANMANNPGLQSGIAIERQQNKGDIGTLEYFKALQVAICQTAKVCIHAMPKMYQGEQEKRVLHEDGSFEMAPLHKQAKDQNGQPIVINDLSVGSYDVTCDVGPAFSNLQEEAADRIEKLGAVDPTFIMQNRDILLNNLSTPGMEQAAERARFDLMKAGAIPESQWTEEEIQQAEAAKQAAEQNPPPVDPATEIAKAEVKKAEAQEQRENIRMQTELIKAQQAQQKLDFEQSKQQLEVIKKGQLEQAQYAKTIAETMKLIKETMGIGGFTHESTERAFDGQAKVLEAQSEVPENQ